MTSSPENYKNSRNRLLWRHYYEVLLEENHIEMLTHCTVRSDLIFGTACSHSSSTVPLKKKFMIKKLCMCIYLNICVHIYACTYLHIIGVQLGVVEARCSIHEKRDNNTSLKKTWLSHTVFLIVKRKWYCGGYTDLVTLMSHKSHSYVWPREREEEGKEAKPPENFMDYAIYIYVKRPVLP